MINPKTTKKKDFNLSIIDFISKYDIDFVNIENHFQEFHLDFYRCEQIDTGFRTVTLRLKPKETEDKMAAKKKVAKKKSTKTNKKK